MADIDSSSDLEMDDRGQLQNPTADDVMDTTEVNSSPDNESVASPLANGVNGETELSREANDEAGDLFGSDSDDNGIQSVDGKTRKLDDEDLDSGDDDGRNDRLEDVDGYDNEEPETQEAMTILKLDLGRHGFPKGSDGELYLLKTPHFLGIEPKSFVPGTFKPPSARHNASGTLSAFSPAQTSATTIRWRRSPRNAQQIQSNTRIIRWSDGSLTMQFGTNPMEQYELPAQPFAPPQHNPHKPTPTAVSGGKAGGDTGTYDPRSDAHMYLASIHQSVSFAQITNHITTGLTVQASAELNDDALVRLRECMAAAKGNKASANGGVGMISITVDPELAKREAELAEREKVRAQRRRQNQEEREKDRANRVLGQSGIRSGRAGGLTVGNLEDGGPNAARSPTKPARKPRRRKNNYSDEEDDFPGGGRTQDDEYDEDDGFVVGNDEEPEVDGDDTEEEEEEEEDVGDEVDAVEPKSKVQHPKGRKATAAADESTGGGRIKRRRVVDDDDED